jgi:hypothetical protein
MFCLILLFPLLLLAVTMPFHYEARPVYYCPVHSCQVPASFHLPATPPPEKEIRK